MPQKTFLPETVTLRVRSCGPIGAFKNRKRAIYSHKKAQTFLITEPDAKRRMKAIIQCIASQLSSDMPLGTAETSMGQPQRVSTACVPHDDSWTWIRELNLSAELVGSLAEEGCDITIERIA